MKVKRDTQIVAKNAFGAIVMSCFLYNYKSLFGSKKVTARQAARKIFEVVGESRLEGGKKEFKLTMSEKDNFIRIEPIKEKIIEDEYDECRGY